MSKEIRDVRDPVAERIVVAAVICDDTAECYAAFRSVCSVEMLTEPPAIFYASAYEDALAKRGAATYADVVASVRAEVASGRADQQLEDTMWEWIRRIGPCTPMGMTEYLRAIATMYAERKSMEQLASALHRAKNAPTSVERAVAMEEARQIRVATNPDATPTKNKRLAEMLSNIMHGKAIKTRIPSALDTVTRMMGGGYLESGLYVWAGPPKFGKTSFAIGEALAAARNTGKRSLFLSLEMPADQLDNRFVSYQSGLPEKVIEAGHEHDMPAIIQAMSELSEINYEVATMVGQRIGAIVRKITDEHERDPLGFIVVDYLQRIPRGDKTMRSDEEIGAQCKALCAVSILVKAPILLLSQLNRGYAERSGRRFQMSDLRGSGEIEADADMIGFIWRDVAGEFGFPLSYAEASIVAHRHAPPDHRQIYYDGATFRFKDATDDIPVQDGGKR